MHLGQTVNLVVMQHHRQIHIVADGMNPMRSADAAAVAVAGVHEDGEIRARHLDAFGHRQCAAVNAVETICLHVMRKAARASDAGDEYGLFRPQVLIAT